MAKPEREFSADVGQKSMGVAGPDYIEKDFDKAFAMFDPNKNLPDGTPGGIGKENMQPGAVDDDVIGNREVDDTQSPTGNIGKLSNFLNWFAYMIKSITGKANWRTKPSYTIEQLGNSTIDGVKNIGGDIDFVAGAGIEITPDAVGKKITFAAKNDAIIPGPHAETHGSIGSDPITPASIGAETPAGAQAKVDNHEAKPAPHSGHATKAELEEWGVPVGTILSFAGQTPPDGYLECNGQAVSRTKYAALFAAIGTIWGSGNGSTTFNLPDLRGEFLRGWDHGRGVDPGRNFGSWQADELKSHRHDYVGVEWQDLVDIGDDTRRMGISAIQTTTATGGPETRPRNIAVMYIIKY